MLWERKAKAKDEIRFLNDPTALEQIKLREIPGKLDIIYEDKFLVVVNKAAGLSIHPSVSHNPEEATLVEYLLKHSQNHHWEVKDYESLRPGVVHRLDKETTGVIVWAKDHKTLDSLAHQFRERSPDKEYLALLAGDFPEKPVVHESYLMRDPKNKTRFISLSEEILSEEEKTNLRWAKSTFIKQETFVNKYSLCKIVIYTGRTHQIRVQAKELGFPVVGDQVYNRSHTVSSLVTDQLKKQLLAVKRQMLHAHKLSFVHPHTQEPMNFVAELPEDFSQLLSSLRSHD